MTGDEGRERRSQGYGGGGGFHSGPRSVSLHFKGRTVGMGVVSRRVVSGVTDRRGVGSLSLSPIPLRWTVCRGSFSLGGLGLSTEK